MIEGGGGASPSRTSPTLRPRLAARFLAQDLHFGPWVQRIGPVRIQKNEEAPFAYLLRAICGQQLAAAAARAIHSRVVDVVGARVTPEAVLGVPPGTLRACGLSGNKLRAVIDLAARAEDGRLVLDGLEKLSDAEIVARLTEVWGLGPWTAQMFLVFRLRRADVWPSGDLAVRNGYARIHALGTVPTPRELEGGAERLRPWRSAAAWYCYRALETDPP